MGDAYLGSCGIIEGEVPDGRLRTCCNTGYARGACPSFPANASPDAVRFGIVARKDGLTKIRYVVEQDHLPFSHGMLELADGRGQSNEDEIVMRQARAFLDSYLRRVGGI